jgi:hypothetical protein
VPWSHHFPSEKSPHSTVADPPCGDHKDDLSIVLLYASASKKDHQLYGNYAGTQGWIARRDYQHANHSTAQNSPNVLEKHFSRALARSPKSRERVEIKIR